MKYQNTPLNEKEGNVIDVFNMIILSKNGIYKEITEKNKLHLTNV